MNMRFTWTLKKAGLSQLYTMFPKINQPLKHYTNILACSIIEEQNYKYNHLMVNCIMLLILFKNTKTIKIDELTNLAFVFANCAYEPHVLYINLK